MSDFYIDVSAIGNEYQAYTDTPTTWGVPQDGNGKAGPGHTAAVAIATIDVAGCTASGTGTIGVLGVTVSSTLNATGAALATAIAAAINASATAVGSTYSALLLPLNKLVYARINPGLSTQVQIMLRIAGTDWASFSPTQANISAAATISNFAGGANGPFAILMNATTMFGKTAGLYGIWSSAENASVTKPTEADLIYVRTKRSAVDLSVAITTTASTTHYFNRPTSGAHYVFDNGTQWSGDAGVFTYQMNWTVQYNIISVNRTLSNTSLSSADNVRRCKFIFNGTASATYSFGITTTAADMRLLYSGCVFEEAATNVSPIIISQSSYGVILGFVNCGFRLKLMRQLAALSNSMQRYAYSGCDFEYFGLVADVTGIVTGNTSAGTGSVEFYGCRFYDSGGVYKVTSAITAGAVGSGYIQYIFDGCSGIYGVSSGLPSTFDASRQLSWENFGPSRDFRYETPHWMVDWNGQEAFPTLSTTLPSGSLYSMRALLRNSLPMGYAARVAKINAFHRDTASLKRMTVELYLPAVVKDGVLGMLLTYIDNTGVVRTETTLKSFGAHKAGTDTNIPTSVATWASNGVGGYTAYKMTLDTAYQVGQDKDVVCHVLFAGGHGSDLTIYIHPDLSIVAI